MSKEPETRYFDFIDQHEARLNLIYRQWEAQIAKQTAANRSRELFKDKLSSKKTTLAGMAIALGSVLVAWQYGTSKVASWQNHRQLNATKNVIVANSQKLDQIAQELSHSAAYNNRLRCVQSGDVYELSVGQLNHQALANQPRSFIPQFNTVSLVRNSIATQRPDVYIRLNPDRNLLLGSISEQDHQLKAEAYLIDLDRDATDLPLKPEEINKYADVQSEAIALHEELSSCLGDIGLMPQVPHFPYAD